MDEKIALVTAMANDAGDAETGTIMGPDGKPVTVDYAEKPFLYYPSHDSSAAAANSYGRDGRIDNPMPLGFFLQQDLRPGAKMRMRFRRAISGDSFLPRPAAEAVPFSSGKLPDILAAKRMLKALHHCEWPALPGEAKHCATSLESMLDFVVDSLGTRELQPLTTTADRAFPAEQLYSVLSWTPAPPPGQRRRSATCPCTRTRTPGTKPYTVRLAGEDGAMVEAAAMCHTNTWAYAKANNSPWDPMRRALRAFGVKAGTTLCHLVPEGDVLWVPIGETTA
ncbi:hypothetical protein Taro_014843 [Colocasia esculenta]|uniref:BURP domain-containing protein n=1 Tax=Colocasia esculenta TaxID=4460 RepID=A0A843UKN1_COLES|nr:hypothetical protein [Colocasia esculenta]